MRSFDKFKKDRQNIPKDVERIFGKLYDIEKVKGIVDKAISFRELGQYDKAIGMLKQVISDYPDYRPAKTVLGVTLLQKGDISEAQKYFKKILAEHSNDNEFMMTDVYANLGSIRWKHYDDIDGALEYYNLALNAPKIPSIDNDSCELIKSNVHKDLCWLYFGQKNLPLARKYAALRFGLVRDCPVASKVLGFCLLEEYAAGYKGFKFVVEDIEPTDLMIAAGCFRTCLQDDQSDYPVLAGSALAYFYLSTCKAVVNDPDTSASVKLNAKQCVNNLYFHASESDAAQKCKEEFEAKVEEFYHHLEKQGKGTIL